MSEGQEELRARLKDLGFDDVRFVRLQPLQGVRLRTWLADGMQADMQWLERSLEKRLNPGLVLPGARSAVLLGVNYWQGEPVGSADPGTSRPVWARYSQYSDYHDTIKPALLEAGREIGRLAGPGEADCRAYVDTGPVIERGWAARAGLGFIGKNGMLISREYGNWLFLAAVLTTVELESDAPLRPLAPDQEEHQVGLLCGRCTRCMDACPTRAIPAPGVVDARRCISYQTIENKGVIPADLRAGIGGHIFGCDVCLDVCPWNRFAKAARRVLLDARPELAALALAEILALTPARFAEVFRGTAVKRLKLAGLLRNACIVAANTKAHDCLGLLVLLAAHESHLVRAHAVWAVQVLAGRERAALLLSGSRAKETVPEVLAEYAASITPPR